jgi:hypothetical protein
MFKWERFIVYSLLIGLFFIIIFKFFSNSSNDTKKTTDEAVKKLAAEERAAASYFEALKAYSPEQRKEALARIRTVQANFGIPYETSKQILEAQKRAFGEINPQSTEQFAIFWALHEREQIPNLIRWMGASGIKTPEEQGKIMRLISAISSQPNKPTNKEIIMILAAYGSRFRNLGWSPEETIINLSKILIPGEDMKKTTEMVLEGLEGFTNEKAHELGMP